MVPLGRTNPLLEASAVQIGVIRLGLMQGHVPSMIVPRPAARESSSIAACRAAPAGMIQTIISALRQSFGGRVEPREA
jgi:hypothetical protein